MTKGVKLLIENAIYKQSLQITPEALEQANADPNITAGKDYIRKTYEVSITATSEHIDQLIRGLDLICCSEAFGKSIELIGFPKTADSQLAKHTECSTFVLANKEHVNQIIETMVSGKDVEGCQSKWTVDDPGGKYEDAEVQGTIPVSKSVNGEKVNEKIFPAGFKNAAGHEADLRKVQNEKLVELKAAIQGSTLDTSQSLAKGMGIASTSLTEKAKVANKSTSPKAADQKRKMSL